MVSRTEREPDDAEDDDEAKDDEDDGGEEEDDVFGFGGEVSCPWRVRSCWVDDRRRFRGRQ